jgi:hypothetical protein
VFENRVLRRIFGAKRDEVTERWRNCITRRFFIYTLHQYNYNDQAEEDEMDWTCSKNGGEEDRL